MGLLVLADPAADDLLEEDLDLLCQCPHPAAEHDADGCRTCACGARCPEDLEAEENEELEAEEVGRVVAFLRAARAKRKLLEEERRERIARDPASSPRSNKPKVTRKAAEPRVPRAAVATAKPKAPVHKVAPTTQPTADGDERSYWQSPEESLLEAVGAL